MDQLIAILSVILFTAILPSAATEGVKYPLYYTHTDIAEFIKTSCNVTRYPQLCVSSLSSYGGRLRAKQSDLVNAAVTVSLLNAGNVSVWAAGLKARGAMQNESEKAALKDCIGNFRDSTYEIKGSLAELKHLKSYTFQFQMSNVQTWMSAALTDQDSCLSGFQDLNASGNVTAMVTGRVQNVCKLISNALALVNTFAATGSGHELHV
jgi:pectinesterase inhibitor-like protein